MSKFPAGPCKVEGGCRNLTQVPHGCHICSSSIHSTCAFDAGLCSLDNENIRYCSLACAGHDCLAVTNGLWANETPPPPEQQPPPERQPPRPPGIAASANQGGSHTMNSFFCLLCLSKDAKQPIPVDIVSESIRHEKCNFGTKKMAAKERERLYLPPEFTLPDCATRQALKEYFNASLTHYNNQKVIIGGSLPHASGAFKGKLSSIIFQCPYGIKRAKASVLCYYGVIVILYWHVYALTVFPAPLLQSKAKKKRPSKRSEDPDRICPFKVVVNYDQVIRRYYIRPRLRHCFTHKTHIHDCLGVTNGLWANVPPPLEQQPLPGVDYQRMDTSTNQGGSHAIDSLFCLLCLSKDARQPIPVDIVSESIRHEKIKFGHPLHHHFAYEWERLYLPPEFTESDAKTRQALKAYFNESLTHYNQKVIIGGHGKHVSGPLKGQLSSILFKCPYGSKTAKSTAKTNSPSKGCEDPDRVCPFKIVVNYDQLIRRYYVRPRLRHCFTHSGHICASSLMLCDTRLKTSSPAKRQRVIPESREAVLTIEEDSGEPINNASLRGPTLTKAADTKVQNRKNEIAQNWLKEALPQLHEDDLSRYTAHLVEDGFDSVELLEADLVGEDLDFMKKAHRRALIRVKGLDNKES